MNLLIKVYRPNDYYPKGGRTSLYLDRIQIGECINIEYPYGNAFYRGEGEFIFKYISNNHLIGKNLRKRLQGTFQIGKTKSFKKLRLLQVALEYHQYIV